MNEMNDVPDYLTTNAKWHIKQENEKDITWYSVPFVKDGKIVVTQTTIDPRGVFKPATGADK